VFGGWWVHVVSTVAHKIISWARRAQVSSSGRFRSSSRSRTKKSSLTLTTWSMSPSGPCCRPQAVAPRTSVKTPLPPCRAKRTHGTPLPLSPPRRLSGAAINSAGLCSNTSASVRRTPNVRASGTLRHAKPFCLEACTTLVVLAGRSFILGFYTGRRSKGWL